MNKSTSLPCGSTLEPFLEKGPSVDSSAYNSSDLSGEEEEFTQGVCVCVCVYVCVRAHTSEAVQGGAGVRMCVHAYRKSVHEVCVHEVCVHEVCVCVCICT